MKVMANRDRALDSTHLTRAPSTRWVSERRDATRLLPAAPAVCARRMVLTSVATQCTHRPQCGRRLLGPASIPPPPFTSRDARTDGCPMCPTIKKAPFQPRGRQSSARVTGPLHWPHCMPVSGSAAWPMVTARAHSCFTTAYAAVTPSWSSFSTTRRRVPAPRFAGSQVPATWGFALCRRSLS